MANGYLPLPGGIGPAQPFPRRTAIASQAASGGSEASVLVTATGAGQSGVVALAGGRTVTETAVGGFRLKKIIRKKGGAVAEVIVRASGAGQKATAAGAIAARPVVLAAMGSGIKSIHGAAIGTANIVSSGDGFADDPELLLRLYASSLLHVRTPAA